MRFWAILVGWDLLKRCAEKVRSGAFLRFEGELDPTGRADCVAPAGGEGRERIRREHGLVRGIQHGTILARGRTGGKGLVRWGLAALARISHKK